ncbi:MFS transporter [Paenibacillus tuaregi]|uniref:MFS transporter n=1 Tax=Paenibacillus tuaregi TaxID=1816681 RepID=UPI0009EF4777|nr:MFS transporter [Paenibacillus tuaregi]
MSKKVTAGIPKSVAWLSFLAFFSVLNETVFNVALPDMAVQFGISPSAANWINTSFILSFAIGTAVYGKLSDLYGVRRLLLTGVLMYGVGSLVGVLFHSSYAAVLIARFIQGAGISSVPALIMVIVAGSIPPKQQGRAFGLIGSVVACGESIGPVIGGVVTHYLHWFYLFALPMLTLLALPFFIRDLPGEPAKKGKLDLPGAVLMSAGIVTFTLFISLYDWMYLLTSLLLFLGFAWRIRKARQPFIEPSLFSRKAFILGVLTGSILLGLTAGYVSMVPYMMRTVHNLPTDLIGIGVLFPGTVSVVLFGILGGMLVDKRGNLFTMRIGIILLILSLLGTALFVELTPWLITGTLILTFGGLSFIKTVISTSVAGALRPEESGSGMGLLNFACFLGEGFGVAVVGGIMSRSWLVSPHLPGIGSSTAGLYSNLTLILIAAALIAGTVFLLVYKRVQHAPGSASKSE